MSEDALRLIDKMAREEADFTQREVLAPVCGPAPVQVRLAGIVVRLRVSHSSDGFYVIRPCNLSRARVVRAATVIEARRYLDLLPRLRLILVRQDESTWYEGAWWAVAEGGRGRPDTEDAAVYRVCLVRGARQFDHVVGRLAGGLVLFDQVVWRAGPRASYLREALESEVIVDDLQRSGVTAQDRLAYALVHQAEEQARLIEPMERVRRALQHSGAEFVEYVEQGDVYVVTYEVDGQQYRTTVRSADLGVVAAGICLSGRDRQFDLTSMVSVLREGQERRRIVRGDYRDHYDYEEDEDDW